MTTSETAKLCECGCGLPTRIPKHSDAAHGHRAGEPLRFRQFHKDRKPGVDYDALESPNPSGICMCGCGEPAPIATYTHTPRGWVKGQPKRFIVGHFSRCPATGTDSDYAIDDAGCWLWLHALDPNGYGRMSLNRKNVMAHRWVYERLRRQLAEGVHLHHKCRVPRCVNPDHLQELTQSAHSRLHGLERSHARLPVWDIAQIMASGGAFVDTDAVRVARAYLDLTGNEAA